MTSKDQFSKKGSQPTSEWTGLVVDSEMYSAKWMAPPPSAPEGRESGGKFLPASFTFKVNPHDIPGGVRELQRVRREESWMVFLFDTTKVSAATDDRGLALQYSVISGEVGIDWVLRAPRNAADAELVAAFCTGSGFSVKRDALNGVDFLRVEDGDLASLGMRILTDLYEVPADAELGLYIDGLRLSGGKRRTP